MAVDEAILEAVGSQSALPTLRLYAWEPPCLSLGFSQSIQDVDCAALQARSWGIVRRPTGGRAILHADELTYALIAPLKEPRVAGSVFDSYRRIAQALLEALRLLGLPAQADDAYPQPGTGAGAVCFEVPSNYEITAAGKKLVGSAQARKINGVLQHGSLPLYGDLTRITQVLRYYNETSRQRAAERLQQHAANAAMLGADITWEQAAAAMEQAFQHALAISFEHQPLTDGERRRVEELVKTKYGDPGWTQRL